MKTKETFGDKAINALIFIFFIILLPFVILYLIYKLLTIPFDYARYKKSLYQRDFPHKYTWLREPHVDNEVYTAIKDNNLPVDYIKQSEEYDRRGYFVYKDILLDFGDPFFFDEEEKQFFYCVENDEPVPVEVTEGEDAENSDCDQRLTVEEAKAFLLNKFSDDVEGRECRRIVFFCSRRDAELSLSYEEDGMNAFRELDDVILYEKGGLAKAIKDFIDNN
ncbi:MAG: hypothetical protein IKJ24_00285 [Clostridia bacterium]|nr:hypothetical protein [Clostridia bacterium]